MTFWKPEYANIGGFGDPTSRYPLGENMTGFKSKQAAAQAKLTEDDDIQDYKKPWVGLTDDEIQEIVGPWGGMPIKGYTRKLFDQIEAKLKEKNT